MSMCSLSEGLEETEISSLLFTIITPRSPSPGGLTVLILTFVQ